MPADAMLWLLPPPSSSSSFGLLLFRFATDGRVSPFVAREAFAFFALAWSCSI